MFNCGTGRARSYLIELLSESVNQRQGLSSASDPGIIYDIPFKRKTRFNDRSFCTIGPKLWNNLPLFIKQSVSIDVFEKKTSKFTIMNRYWWNFAHLQNAFSGFVWSWIILVQPILRELISNDGQRYANVQSFISIGSSMCLHDIWTNGRTGLCIRGIEIIKKLFTQMY